MLTLNVTKSEQKAITRAYAQGRGAVLKTLAILHRSGSSRTQKAIHAWIDASQCMDEFKLVNGALLHSSEV